MYENLICGGCMIDDQESKALDLLYDDLLDTMQKIVAKLIEMRKQEPLPRETICAINMHDFECIIEDTMCMAEDDLREELVDYNLTEESQPVLNKMADTYEQIKRNQASFIESLKK